MQRVIFYSNAIQSRCFFALIPVATMVFCSVSVAFILIRYRALRWFTVNCELHHTVPVLSHIARDCPKLRVAATYRNKVQLDFQPINKASSIISEFVLRCNCAFKIIWHNNYWLDPDILLIEMLLVMSAEYFFFYGLGFHRATKPTCPYWGFVGRLVLVAWGSSARHNRSRTDVQVALQPKLFCQLQPPSNSWGNLWAAPKAYPTIWFLVGRSQQSSKELVVALGSSKGVDLQSFLKVENFNEINQNEVETNRLPIAIIPRLQMSTFFPYCLRVTTSGALHNEKRSCKEMRLQS